MRRPPTIGMTGIDFGRRHALTFVIDPPDYLNSTVDPYEPDCSINNVTMTPNGVAGVDFGPSTARPIQMSYADYQTALNQHALNPAFCPLTAHTASIDVTPPCDHTGEVIANPDTGSFTQVVRRVPGTCFLSESSLSLSNGDGTTFTDPSCPGDDPTCDPTCNQRSAAWGASGIVDESINFGDISFSDASFADVPGGSGIVWVAYSFTASSLWTCSTTGCEFAEGRPCVNGSGDPCGPAGGSTSGAVCVDATSVGDATSPPAGTTSQVNIQFSGSGWSTNAGVTALFFQSPPALPGGCTTGMQVTY